MTLHWRDGGGHRQRNQRFRGDDFSDGFHVIGAEWSPERTVWYVDGVERARMDDGAAEMAAQGPFYALLDLQVGLQGAVQPSAATPFPADDASWGTTGPPLRRDQNPGKAPPSVPSPTTGTPSVSSRSRVRGRSRKDLAPAQTVTTGWRARAPRSALSSAVSATSRCTPP